MIELKRRAEAADIAKSQFLATVSHEIRTSMNGVHESAERGASGGRDAERVKLKLEIKVQETEYHKQGVVLRIWGKNILQNEHVKIGPFHTLELELHRPFVLRKVLWNSFARDTLKQASDPDASADLVVVLMQEGLAHIFLVGKSMTITRAWIETSIPRKHGLVIAGYESVGIKAMVGCIDGGM